MPFQVDSLITIMNRTDTAYQNLMKNKKIPVSDYKVKARILSNCCNALNHYISFMGKQIIPTDAEKEYLEKHCAAKKIFRKRPEKAYGQVSVKGVVKAEILKETIINRTRDNLAYKVKNSIILSSEEVEITIECTKTGTAGNCEAGEKMTFSKAIAGIENEVTVIAVGAGADEESDTDLLSRYLNFMQNVAEGGSGKDYIRWALEVSGVNRAWSVGHEAGWGTVVVRIMTPNGIADEVLCEKVKAYIDSVRPLTVKRLIIKTLGQDFIDITARIVPDIPEVRAAAETELHSLFLRDIEPGMKIVKSKITEAISIAPGEDDHKLIEPTTDLEARYGAYLVLRSVIWI